MCRHLIVSGLFLFFFSVGNTVRGQGSTGLLLTELYYDTPGPDGDEEWIEIANLGGTTIDLSDFKVGDEESFGGQEGMIRFPLGASIEPGEVIVVSQTATGFRTLFGRNPDYEIKDTDSSVPDMDPYPAWAEGELALANDGDELLLLDDQDNMVDMVNYGESSYYFSPTVNDVITGQSIERIPADCDTNTAVDWQPQSFPSPGILIFSGDCRVPIEPTVNEQLLIIGEIQGDQDVSPYLNQEVTFRGVVIGSYEDQNTRGVTFYTLFVQDLIGFEDGDPATSDGIAVFMGIKRPLFSQGDQVRIRGLVTEFFGLTEIDDESLEIVLEKSGIPLPDPFPIELPDDGISQYFESIESMYVSLEGNTPVIAPTYAGCGFVVAHPAGGFNRVIRRSAEDLIEEIIPILHVTDIDCTGFPNVKSGDMVTGLAGPLIYHFDQFKIVQQNSEQVEVIEGPGMAIPELPPLTDDQVSIATFNFENHFDEIDDTGDEAEPKPDASEINIKQDKLAYAISQTLACPTIVGVQEVEKLSLLQDLAERVAQTCGFSYEISHKESADVRGIDLAFLSNPNRVKVTNDHLQQGCTTIETGIVDETVNCPPGQEPLFSRPPLQVNTEIDGENFTFIVNHFKSKREGEALTSPRRLAQAQFIATLVEALLNKDERARIVVLGDFNDFDLSPTMKMIVSGNSRLTNSLWQIPEQDRYSFIFNGESQLIDGILVSPELMDDIVLVHIMHVNADYPYTLQYDISRTGLPFRSSDHDLPLLILSLEEKELVEELPLLEITPNSTNPPVKSPVISTPDSLLVGDPTISEHSNSDKKQPGGILFLTGVLGIGAIIIAWIIRARHN